MARPVWSGTISFGLVAVPVRMFAAEHDHDISFHQLNESTGHRIKYRKVDAESGREVDKEHIIKGYEVHRGEYVTFTDEEIEEIRPTATKTIDIEDFVELADIDPIYYERTYYLAPTDDVAARRAYRLLHDAMEDRGRAGIGTVVMHSKQYLAAIRPLRGALAMSTMRFHDEVVDPSSLEDLDLGSVQVDPKAQKMAVSLIDSLATDFEPTKYHDTFTEEVRAAIERKAQGETIEVEAPVTEAKVLDLVEALQASLAARRGAGGTPTAKKPAAKKPAAKKPAAKKPAARKPAAKKTAAKRRAA